MLYEVITLTVRCGCRSTRGVITSARGGAWNWLRRAATALKRGKNHLTVEVYNTPANHYSKKALPSGIENGISIVKNKNK